MNNHKERGLGAELVARARATNVSLRVTSRVYLVAMSNNRSTPTTARHTTNHRAQDCKLFKIFNIINFRTCASEFLFVLFDGCLWHG